MQIDIHREQKIVCIWLSRKESSEYKNEKSPILTPLFEGYRKRAYHIAVFMSGSGIYMTVCLDCSYITAVRWQKRN